jgi:transposase InsO family protein
LRLAGLARSSWHYLQHPRPRVASPKPQATRRSPVWTTAAEEQQVLSRLAHPAYALLSIAAVFIKALDAGVFIASMRTWYRVAQRHRVQRRTGQRRRATHRSRAIPELLATAVNQVWSWDITKLPTPIRGQFYEFYVVLDVFSRYVVGYRVEEVESDQLARDMFETAMTGHGARPEVVHSDGGPSMTSSVVTEFLTELKIRLSRNRPRVSNDNPYSESAFKTAKYRPDYPEIFHSLEQARAWADDYIRWYNHDHQHSGIAWHTPHNVYTGAHHQVTARRQAVLDRHYQANPHRHHQPPTAPRLEAEVWINNPAKRPTH